MARFRRWLLAAVLVVPPGCLLAACTTVAAPPPIVSLPVPTDGLPTADTSAAPVPTWTISDNPLNPPPPVIPPPVIPPPVTSHTTAYTIPIGNGEQPPPSLPSGTPVITAGSDSNSNCITVPHTYANGIIVNTYECALNMPSS